MYYDAATRAPDAQGALALYAPMVYRLALLRCKNKYDAEDVFQEVFLRLVTKAPAFESEEHRRAWLIRVTINCTKKLFDSAWFRCTEGLDESLPTEDPQKSEVYYAVCALPVKYRTVVHLFYYERYTTAEIAKIMDMNESTVKTQLKRARERLKEALKGGFDE